jgi:hypothetical protein
VNYWKLWLSVLVLAIACWAQTSGNAQTSSQNSVNANVSNGTAINSQNAVYVQAVLTKTVDARKAKEGDSVEAKTTAAAKSSENVELPKGTKLIGHVTQVKSRSKDDAHSKLGVLFDKAVLKSGREIPFQALISSATAPKPTSMSTDADMNAGIAASSAANHPSMGASPVGGLGGGALSTVGNTAGSLGSAASQTVGNVAGSTVGAQTNSDASLGVAGVPLHGISLDTQTSNTTGGSVFQSNQQNVKLESGTVLILRATN